MHQSPQKQPSPRRDKYGQLDAEDADPGRRIYRGSQPRARKFSLREDGVREPRRRQGPG